MAETELQVILKSMELAEHTFRLTSNCNHYPKKYRFSLVDKIQNGNTVKLLHSMDLYIKSELEKGYG